MHSHSHLAWARLNSDAFLLVILGIIAVLDLTDPNADDIVRQLGYVPPTLYVWSACYIVGSVLLVGGLLARRIDVELGGRGFICFAAILETVRVASVFGWGSTDAFTDYVVAGVVLMVCIGRATVLWSKQIMAITLGGGN